jgi:hypothetical protein
METSTKFELITGPLYADDLQFGLALCVGSITGYMFEYKKYFCYDYNSKFSEWPKKWVYKDCYTETYYHTSHALAVGTLTLGLSL